MDYFNGMQCIDELVCSSGYNKGKISYPGIVKKWFNLDVTKRVKLLAALPLAR